MVVYFATVHFISLRLKLKTISVIPTLVVHVASLKEEPPSILVYLILQIHHDNPYILLFFSRLEFYSCC
jgi:hypothetical protein